MSTPIDLVLPPGLAASADFSEQQLRRIRRGLHARQAALEGIHCVAAAGSLGRLEAGPESDVDCVVVARDTACAPQIAAGVDAVIAAIADSDLRPPKAGGFFRRTVRTGELLDIERLGRLDESPNTYGKRLQCLLDTRPLFAAEAFDRLRQDVLRWFSCGQPRATPLALLAGELVRYRRSYVAYQTYCFDHGAGDSWRLRMAKLRSSRLVTVTGLLAVLGEASREQDPLRAAEHCLTRSPLERLYGAMAAWNVDRAHEMLAYYERAHLTVGRTQTRGELLAGEPVTLAHLEGATPSLGEALDGALQGLEAGINDFLLDQREHWGERFFRAMLL